MEQFFESDVFAYGLGALKLALKVILYALDGNLELRSAESITGACSDYWLALAGTLSGPKIEISAVWFEFAFLPCAADV